MEEWKDMTAQQLMDKKDSIEEEIKSLHDELENVGNVVYERLANNVRNCIILGPR